MLTIEVSESTGLGNYEVAPGLEFLGSFDQHGFASPLYLVRRGDGRTLQLSEVSYRLLETLREGPCDPSAAAERLSEAVGQKVEAAGVARLIEEKFGPLALIVRSDCVAVEPYAVDLTRDAEPPKSDRSVSRGNGPIVSNPSTARNQDASDPIFRIRLRRELLKASTVHRVARASTPLFSRWVVIPAVIWLLGFDLWVLTRGGATGQLVQQASDPKALLLILLITLASVLAHEIGHAVALVRAGGTPGPIGVGFFLTLPVAFSNVSDSYRLTRRQRVSVDLGGVSANMLVAGGFALGSALTDQPILLVIVVTQQLMALQQLLPFVRLDGYWLVSDLIGVPDLFGYIPAVLARVFKGRRHPLLARLRPWPRRIVVTWVVVTLSMLVIQLTTSLLLLTRVGAASAALISELFGHIGAGLTGSGSRVVAVLAAFDLVLVAGPSLAILPILYSVGSRFLGWIWSRRHLDPILRGGLIFASLQAVWSLVVLGALR